MRIIFYRGYYAVVAKLFRNQFEISSCFKHVGCVRMAERVEGAETEVLFAPGIKSTLNHQG